jgi:hypothetical protein
MNKALETIRGFWITRDREAAETNRAILRDSIDQIPSELREKFFSIVDWADRIEASSDVILDGAVKDCDRQTSEIIFLEAQIKGLIEAIRLTKDVDSIQALRVITRETIGRIQERKHQEELKRLQQEGATFRLPDTPVSIPCLPQKLHHF